MKTLQNFFRKDINRGGDRDRQIKTEGGNSFRNARVQLIIPFHFMDTKLVKGNMN